MATEAVVVVEGVVTEAGAIVTKEVLVVSEGVTDAVPVADMLSEFCERARDSVYGERFRVEIMSILVGWKKMVEA